MKSPAVPAVTGDGKPPTANWVTVPGVTWTAPLPAELPSVMPGSAAVTVCVPAVTSRRLVKAWTARVGRGEGVVRGQGPWPPGSEVVKWTVPVYPVATSPAASRAVTVRPNGDPAATADASGLTVKCSPATWGLTSPWRPR